MEICLGEKYAEVLKLLVGELKGGLLGVLVVTDAGWWMEVVAQHWAGTAGSEQAGFRVLER